MITNAELRLNKKAEQEKLLKAKTPFHVDILASTCDHLEKPSIDNYPIFKEDKELGLMELVEIVENKSTACPRKHNSDTAIYRQFKGAVGYDNLNGLNEPR